MDSTNIRTTSTPAAASAAPVFSYAQAAKGRAISAATSATQCSQTPSGVSTPAKESKSFSNTPSGSVNGAPGSDAGERSVNGTQEVVSLAESVGADTSVEMRAEAKSATNQTSVSIPTSPSYGSASTATLTKEDALSLLGAAPSEPHSSSRTEKHAEHGEGRRGRKGKKRQNGEKEAEKEKEEVKPEVLVPAQAPTVNIWKQRIEEQAAKVKANPVLPQSPQSPSESNDTSQASKTGDQRKRGKVSTADEGEYTIIASQNGGSRETSNGKGQRKGSEGGNRTKDDAPAKRSGGRNGRGSEKDERPVPTQLPPPVEDATSWPTPETALEEERRKAQEKEKLEREDKEENSNKPRQKEKWVSVPYIPTVTFNTPMPTRGARGRGGARGGRQDAVGRSSHLNGGSNGEKSHNGSPPISTAQGEAEKHTLPRANSLPPSNSKKQQNDQLNPRERKYSTAPLGEKSKAAQAKSDPAPVSDEPRVASSSKPEQSSEGRRDQHFNQADNFKGLKSDAGQVPFGEHQPSSRPGDRRSEPNLRGSELFKDGNMFNKESNQGRDRADGRSDRGRAGFRGRGGHGTFPNGQQNPQHLFTNGHGPLQPTGYAVRPLAGPYSPPLQQGPFSNQFNSLPMRGARGGSRSQSIPNNNLFGRFPSNGASQQMAPLQTTNPMFDYPLQALNAAPYNPFVDQYSVLAMVTMQLDYYFSIDNLCKDVYLRKHMDSQGFVFLTFIAGFKRIQALTQEFELLRYACQESDVIEIIRGEDGIDRLRRREGWEQWVLAKEDRDESVRSDGPVIHHRQPPAQISQTTAPMVLQSHPVIAAPTFAPNGTESSFRPYGNGLVTVPVLNGNGTTHHPETPLSAAVPDFSPSLPPLTSSPAPLDLEVTFTDEDVADLMLVFNTHKGADEQTPKMPVRNISSRTFSNGSIDGRAMFEELHDDSRKGRTLTNGSSIPDTSSPESVKRSLSPLSPLSLTKYVNYNGPPVMWVKGSKAQAPIGEHNTVEMYTTYRARAIKHREASTSGVIHDEMKLLYEFWSHFLCRNFNLDMYSEFRKYACEDAEQKSMVGMSNLIQYFDEILNNKKKVIPETLARHYIELVKFEQTIAEPKGNRPALSKLRAAWRNGAVDMKSRKKIDNFVDAALRAELER